MPANPWLVPITTLRKNLGSRRSEQRFGHVGELIVAGSSVPAGADVRAEATLASVDGGIEVIADITAPWQGECRRCLGAVSGELHAHVRELYRARASHHARPAPHAQQTHAPHGPHAAAPSVSAQAGDEDEETYPLEGELLDLLPLVRDAVLLELPMAPLCRDGCKGLCPTCGADLNDGPCRCDPTPVDPRWAALDTLVRRPGSSGPGYPGGGRSADRLN